MKNFKSLLFAILFINLIFVLAACGAKADETAADVPDVSAQLASESAAPAQPVEHEAEAVEPELSEAEKLVARAAQMQDYSHAEGEDAPPISVVDDNILLLINKTHPLSSDYKADDLVTVTRFDSNVGTAETHTMRGTAAEALEKLMDGAAADGYNIVLRTGYRSYAYQKDLYNSYVANHGEAEANRYSAKPGESEHQTGLCCDVGVPGRGLTSFNGSAEADWIAENCHNYGFILRYPEGKEEVTGYMYESWHIRYVGIDVATEIYEQNTTLEEYLGVVD